MRHEGAFAHKAEDTERPHPTLKRWSHLPDRYEPVELSADEQALFQSVLEQIEARRTKVLAQTGHADGPFLVLNGEGRSAPLFWCFNSWAEAVILARRLGPDQPLFALHSFNKITSGLSYKVRLMEPLAQHYAEAILRVAGTDTPAAVGANCQAAAIGEATAHALMRAGAPAPLLATLEFMPQRPYPGPLYLMFGEQSDRYNPFLSDMDPVPGWRRLHTHFDWGFVPGPHGRYFTEPAVGVLAQRIRHAMDWARTAAGPA